MFSSRTPAVWPSGKGFRARVETRPTLVPTRKTNETSVSDVSAMCDLIIAQKKILNYFCWVSDSDKCIALLNLEFVIFR